MRDGGFWRARSRADFPYDMGVTHVRMRSATSNFDIVKSSPAGARNNAHRTKICIANAESRGMDNVNVLPMVGIAVFPHLVL